MQQCICMQGGEKEEHRHAGCPGKDCTIEAYECQTQGVDQHVPHTLPHYAHPVLASKRATLLYHPLPCTTVPCPHRLSCRALSAAVCSSKVASTIMYSSAAGAADKDASFPDEKSASGPSVPALAEQASSIASMLSKSDHSSSSSSVSSPVNPRISDPGCGRGGKGSADQKEGATSLRRRRRAITAKKGTARLQAVLLTPATP